MEFTKEHVNIIFIGHVDAGKSTICGQIMFQLGLIDKQTIEKNEREAEANHMKSWSFSYFFDTYEDERTKGKTIEVGSAIFETEKKRYIILDAPGHKNYVPNMILGCVQADVALLVISARKGEFETGFLKSGQTKEHAIIAKTLGVNRLMVLINKMDDSTVEWNKERYDEIVGHLIPFLKNIGYRLTDEDFIPISGQLGINIKQNNHEIHTIKEKWYESCEKSLIGYLDNLPKIPRQAENYLLRIPISNKIKEDSQIWIVGKVEAGSVNVGDQVFLGKQSAKVTDLMIDTQKISHAKTGENIKLMLKGIDDEKNIRIGSVIFKDNIICQTKFEALIVIIDLPQSKSVFSSGYNCVLHIHTATRECTVVVILSEVEKNNPNVIIKKKPQFVTKESAVRCILECSSPVCAELFSNVPQLGRFILRDETTTVGFGKIMSFGPKK